ncbi:hypothetical protein CLOM_g8897 [Closterium sp. NIES-68]|nr:hypothetical protein CLOM_g8897 [Closterium sp. NIES-68]
MQNPPPVNTPGAPSTAPATQQQQSQTTAQQQASVQPPVSTQSISSVFSGMSLDGSSYMRGATAPNTVNSRYDLSALRDASILIPNNAQAEALAKRIPAKSSSIPTVYNITAFHILRKRMTVRSCAR